jgi:hypothetical protein
MILTLSMRGMRYPLSIDCCWRSFSDSTIPMRESRVEEDAVTAIKA